MRRTYRRPQQKETGKRLRTNEQISSPTVIVIDDENENIGILPTREAIAMAREKELDLVEVNPTGKPPVTKIMDYGQFKYREDKKVQKQKSKQKKLEIKGVRLSVRISEHDMALRLEQGKKFLEKGNKLKIELTLKGRERQHPEKAAETINNFAKILENSEDMKIIREQDLTKQSGRFSMILANKIN